MTAPTITMQQSIRHASNSILNPCCSLPNMTSAACLQRDVVPSDPAGLLQLEVNSHSQDVAAAVVASLLPAQLGPEEARKLLLTAAVRQHDGIVSSLMQHPGVVQHIDAATVEAAVSKLLAWRVEAARDGLLQYMLAAVCSMPASSQLGADALERLLHSAIGLEMHSSAVVFKLIQLPAAQQLSSSTVAACLQVSVRQGNTDCTRALCQMPAAYQLSSDMLAELLVSALQPRPYFNCTYWNDDIDANTRCLCELPAAAEVSVE
jgi:hypothetical protein